MLHHYVTKARGFRSNSWAVQAYIIHSIVSGEYSAGSTSANKSFAYSTVMVGHGNVGIEDPRTSTQTVRQTDEEVDEKNIAHQKDNRPCSLTVIYSVCGTINRDACDQ